MYMEYGLPRSCLEMIYRIIQPPTNRRTCTVSSGRWWQVVLMLSQSARVPSCIIPAASLRLISLIQRPLMALYMHTSLLPLHYMQDSTATKLCPILFLAYTVHAQCSSWPLRKGWSGWFACWSFQRDMFTWFLNWAGAHCENGQMNHKLAIMVK